MIDRLTVHRLLGLCFLSAIVLAGGCRRLSGLPVVLFALSPRTGESPLVVTFDASASYAPNGAIVRFDWEFGDGSAGTARSSSHTYVVDSETVFTVRLTVTDTDGNQASGTQTLTVFRAPPPPEVARVEFVWPFHYDAEGNDAANLNDEYFTLENAGTEPVDLGGWTVSNERGAVFRFPDGYALAVGAVVFVHSGTGTNSENIFFWGAAAPVWNNDSDIAVLCDATGLIIDIYHYASC